MRKTLTLYIITMLALVLSVGCGDGKTTKKPDTPAARKARMQQVLDDPEVKQAEERFTQANRVAHEQLFDKVGSEQYVATYSRIGNPRVVVANIREEIIEDMKRHTQVVRLALLERIKDAPSTCTKEEIETDVSTSSWSSASLYNAMRNAGVDREKITALDQAIKAWLQLLLEKYYGIR